ncbi:uncharacterized protein LOC108116419 [Drosophila eugracilis]|uniref:uncharacterized protein LOC108116419 n=1 Tax=Drosophila eugracilis TaxID=29029 RepID=UPI001BDAF374|nr:uncharacterized protein LOC108116419 [Drosophila eugracilis]
MSTKQDCLELLSLLVHAKNPKPQELKPCNQHELLMQLISRRKEQLTKNQLADLLWNISNGPKKKTSRSKRRQCGGMDCISEPTDAEVVFGCREKMPPSTIAQTGWERSRIEWLRKLEIQQRQCYEAWQETTGVPSIKVESKPGKKDKDCKIPSKKVKNCRTPSKKGKPASEGNDKSRSRNKKKIPGWWSLLPFSCGWDLAHDSSCQDVPHRKKSS